MNESLRILLVEDNPGDARLLRELLPRSFTITHAERLDDALSKLGGASFDAALLDLTLPDSSGLDTFRKLHKAAPDLPVVVLTGLTDGEGAVQAVREGAQDWLVKGHADSEVLVRALRYGIERVRLLARLRELDRLRSLFLSVVSHDLRSPNAAIQAGVDLLLTERLGPLTPKQRHALDLVRRNGVRQTRLVSDLLDVATIEAGALVLRKESVSLDALAQSTLEELAPLALERGLEVQRDLTPTTVHGDEGRLAQALANLIANAVKFAATRVTVRVDCLDDRARVTVEDDGSGIPEALVDTLFERFVRGEGPRGGSGLGLSIVRGIVDGHGGTVWAENRAEGGARLVMTIPV